jgi:hypothetical protein
MLDRIDSNALIVILALVELGCLLLGLVADAFLRSGGFYKLGNTLILNAGAFGTVFGLDYLYRYNYITAQFLTPDVWIGLPPLAACLLLVTACLIKMLAGKLLAARHKRGLP